MKKSRITPALNAQITDRARKLCEEANSFTKSDFDKAFDKAIVEFGFKPKTYHAHAKKYF